MNNLTSKQHQSHQILISLDKLERWVCSLGLAGSRLLATRAAPHWDGSLCPPQLPCQCRGIPTRHGIRISLAIQILTAISSSYLALDFLPSRLHLINISVPLFIFHILFLYTSVAGRPLSLSTAQGLHCHQPQTCNSNFSLFCPSWLSPLLLQSVCTTSQSYLHLTSMMDGSILSPVWIHPQPRIVHEDQSRKLLTLFPAQSTQTQPNGEGAAMSTESGGVVSFSTADVYKGKFSCPPYINPRWMLMRNSGFKRRC
jgi:hypothetical protein